MRTSVLSACCFVLAVTNPAIAQTDQPQPTNAIHLVTPLEGDTLIGRRPEIRAVFHGAPPAELLVILDGTDITLLLERTAAGFSFHPPQTLPAGSHYLQITTRDAAGFEFEISIGFNSRHGTTVLEATSQNEVGYAYDMAVATRQYPQELPKQRLEGVLLTDSKVKTDHWQMSLNGGLRHLEQTTDPLSPLSRGVDATTWLLTLSYNRDLAAAEARFGDIQINETNYTVTNLSRRGGDINISYDRLRLHLFNVSGQQHFGFRGGTGVGTDMDSYISGVAAGIKLLDDHVEVKGVYADGGEAGSSYNIGTGSGGKRGSVAGGQINSDFFQGKLRSEVEYARTRYNADTSESSNSNNDNAWRVKLSGAVNAVTYDGQYEYVGTDFTSIGNISGITNDRKGAAVRSGLLLGKHSISANLSRYADNVSDDRTRPRIVSYQGGIDYAYGGWPKIPFGVSLQTGLLKSEKEPSGSERLELQTDTVSGRIGFLSGNFRIQAFASGSQQNDDNSNESDGKIAAYKLTPSYVHGVTQLSTALQLLQTWRNGTERTDRLTTSFDLRSAWLDTRLTGEIGGTYSVVTRHDNKNSLILNGRLGYALPEFWGGIKSSLALRGSYNHRYDGSSSAFNRDELSAFLVLTTTVPVIW